KNKRGTGSQFGGRQRQHWSWIRYLACRVVANTTAAGHWRLVPRMVGRREEEWGLESWPDRCLASDTHPCGAAKPGLRAPPLHHVVCWITLRPATDGVHFI
ncbi:hypothetical protein BaRGS_00009335, partial [Batillaria attramentaria]